MAQTRDSGRGLRDTSSSTNRRRPSFELAAAEGLAHDGWQPLQVRNTFIHGLSRSPSLEDFYHEREVCSCPGSSTGCLADLFEDEVVEEEEAATVSGHTGQTGSTTVTPMLTPRSGWSEAEGAATQYGLPHFLPMPMVPGLPAAHPSASTAAPAAAARDATSMPWPSPGAVVVRPWVLEQQELGRSTPMAAAPAFAAAQEAVALVPSPCGSRAFASHVGGAPSAAHARRAQPQVATAPSAAAACPTTLQATAGGVPSAGSALHAAGRCKPCAFVHSKGCTDGHMCQFCHLCEPGEKKRRQREKLKNRKAAYKLKKAATAGL